jgi:hypothetical protein
VSCIDAHAVVCWCVRMLVLIVAHTLCEVFNSKGVVRRLRRPFFSFATECAYAQDLVLQRDAKGKRLMLKINLASLFLLSSSAVPWKVAE